MTLDMGGTVLGASIGSSNGTAPRCAHLDILGPVEPRSAGCGECPARKGVWVGLVMCLTCGWVACSDDSPHRHARTHYEETDHPIVGALGAKQGWRWCYVDRRVV
jgi:uncharacterized UBP type Zn finger protein